MDRKESDDPATDDKVGWHQAFFEAIQVELDAYGDALQFENEYHLSREPLRVDVLIIKKLRDTPIRKNIAAMFRRHNIVEYKSPGDYVSVRTFHKVYAYARLYASEVKDTDIREITLTFVGSGHPRKLFSHLREVEEYTVEEMHPGIYTVSGGVLPIQVIDIRRLPAEENLWLKGLGKKLSPARVLQLTDEAARQEKEARLGRYLYTVIKANAESFEEALKMGSAAVTIDKVLKDAGFTARWQAEGEARGEARGRQEGRQERDRQLRSLLDRGCTTEDIRRELGL